MFRARIAFASACMLAALATFSGASAQTSCNCAQSSLTGTSAGTLLDNFFTPPVMRTVGSGVELPNAGTTLGVGSNRWNIDFGANTIRIDFIEHSTYGGLSKFTFSNLHPNAPAGCTGTPFVSGMTVTTNKAGAAPYVVVPATFTATTATIPFSPATNIDWYPGEYILVTLQFACSGGGTTQTNNPCCPPWNSTTLGNTMTYHGSGGIMAPFTLTYTPNATLNAQMEAYVAYLSTLGLGINSITVTFELQDGGTGTTSSPGTQIGAFYSITWTSGSATTATFFPGFPMVVNHWYHVSTVTKLNNNITYFPDTCINNSIDVRLQFTQSIAAVHGGGAAPAMLQIRTADGHTMEQAVSPVTQNR